MTAPLLIVNVYSTGMLELHMLVRALHITAILSIVVMFIPCEHELKLIYDSFQHRMR